MNTQVKILSFGLVIYAMVFFALYGAIKIMVGNLETQKLQRQDMIAVLQKKQTNLIAHEQVLQSQSRITQIAAEELGLIPETGRHPALIVPKELIVQMEMRNGYAH